MWAVFSSERKTMKNATPIKLRNGSWGAKITGSASIGDTITITAKNGRVWNTTVTQVVFSNDGVTLVATAKHSKEYTQNGRCKGCGGPVVNASHHRAMAGYCGTCAFDEFDM